MDRTFSDAFVSSVVAVAVLQLGLSAGAMAAEMSLLVPFWRGLEPADFLAWYAGNAQRLFDFFAPLETGSALLTTIAAAVFFYGRRPGRVQLLVAAVLSVCVLVPYPLYFEAVNESFAHGTIEHARVADELARWSRWHGMRTAVGLAAFAAATLGAMERRRAA